MLQQIKFGSRIIAFDLEYKIRKSLGIKVFPDCSVKVLAPLAAKEDQILAKVKFKAPWIIKQIDHFRSYKPGTPTRQYVNGETHLYLGRQYRLKIIVDQEDLVKAYRGLIVVHSKNRSPQTIEKEIQSWYRLRASIIFHEIFEEVFPKFKKYIKEKPSLTIRHMSKRWGSCTAKGRIILNTELIKAPKGCIEYVIIHELAHLVHYNHASTFKALQRRMMPDWEKWKERLEYLLA